MTAVLWAPSLSQAASVTAISGIDQITIGESTEIEVWLNLEPGEDASIFEGRFDLIGTGTAVEAIVPADLTPGGPSWGTTAGGIVGTQAQVSVTSSNAGGSRLVATLTVVGNAAGTFQIELAAGTFAQRDLDVLPFFEDVSLTTSIGTVLTSITVAAPSSVPSLGGARLAILIGILLTMAIVTADD